MRIRDVGDDYELIIDTERDIWQLQTTKPKLLTQNLKKCTGALKSLCVCVIEMPSMHFLVSCCEHCFCLLNCSYAQTIFTLQNMAFFELTIPALELWTSCARLAKTVPLELNKTWLPDRDRDICSSESQID